MQFAVELFLDAVGSFRHELTGGVRLLKQDATEDQKSDLLRLNLTERVSHGIYCKPREKFPPLPSFSKALQEQTGLLLTLVATEDSNVHGEPQI